MTAKLKQGTKPRIKYQHCACQTHCRARVPTAGAASTEKHEKVELNLNTKRSPIHVKKTTHRWSNGEMNLVEIVSRGEGGRETASFSSC